MKDNVVGLGVAGCGAVGIRSAFEHFKFGEFDQQVRIVACCDPVPGRAKAAAEKYNVNACYESFEELLADSNVDAVTICSPIGLHYEQGMAALRAGKHIHFNKTMTTQVWQADDIINLAAEKGLKVVASPGQMLYPQAQRTRRIILEEKLGRLGYVYAKHSFSSGIYHLNEQCRTGDDPLTNINPTWYFKNPGGGPHYDVTVYYLHQLVGVLGPAKKVVAISGQQIKEIEFKGERIVSEVDDTSTMLIDFGNSIFATIQAVSVPLPFVCLTPDYFGTEGSIVAEAFNGKPLIYEGEHLPHVTGIHDTMAEKHVFEDIMQLVDLIRLGKPTIVTPEIARHVIEIIEASYKSAEEEKAIHLKTTFEPMALEELLEL